MPSRTDCRQSRRSFAPLLHAAFFSALAFGMSGCKGARYGISNAFRDSPDYEEIENSRSQSVNASAFHGECTGYRGPTGDGSYEAIAGVSLASVSSEGFERLWSVPVGPSYSQVVVSHGLALVTEQSRDEEVLIALSADDGTVVWENRWPGKFYEMMRKSGPAGTPVIRGDRVAVLGAAGELRCIDMASGELRWRTNVRETEGGDDLMYGLCASLVCYDGILVAQGARSVQAYRIENGTPVWTAAKEQLAYATPVFCDVLGRKTLLVSTANRVVGLDPSSGNELWSFPWKVSMSLSCTQPMIVDANRILLSAGYGKGSQLFSLRRTESGDVEVKSEWRSSRFKSRFNEPVLVGNHVFGFDEGVFACLDVTAGKRAWKKGRYGYGQVVAIGTELLVIDESGDLRIIEPSSEELRELRKVPGLDGDFTLNMPCIAGDRLFLRNDEQVVCLSLREPQL